MPNYRGLNLVGRLPTIVSSLLLMIGSGCTSVFPPKIPVETSVAANSGSSVSNSRLIVMLPGRHSRGSHFDREGITEVLAQLPETDVVAADLHFGYYRNRTFLERLREDVILPARKNGYREIHLFGVSMGGMGALFYATKYPNDVDALALLSPFVGDEEILSEIEDSGGIRSWSPGEIAESDYQRRLWGNLKELSSHIKGGKTALRLWLACGEADRLFESNEFFAKQLGLSKPDEFVQTKGEHDWASWREMTEAYARSLN